MDPFLTKIIVSAAVKWAAPRILDAGANLVRKRKEKKSRPSWEEQKQREFTVAQIRSRKRWQKRKHKFHKRH